MPITIHVHLHGADSADHLHLLAKLDLLIAQGKTLMTTSADILAKNAAIRAVLDNVAADIARIKASIAGGLTAAEADAVNADLDVTLARVTGIDADTPEA